MRRDVFGPLALAAALSLSACGGDGPGTTTRACDWTGIPTNRTCATATGPAPEVEAARSTCVDARNGVWADQCPSAELLGCCHFEEFGLARSDCFYTKEPPWPVDLETACHAEHDPAVWTTTL
jgi:hypothetical protein